MPKFEATDNAAVGRCPPSIVHLDKCHSFTCRDLSACAHVDYLVPQCRSSNDGGVEVVDNAAKAFQRFFDTCINLCHDSTLQHMDLAFLVLEEQEFGRFGVDSRGVRD